jgi:predicted nucleic acid-binding protein
MKNITVSAHERVIAAALESGASILYSEDLQHRRQIGSLQIINPFWDPSDH